MWYASQLLSRVSALMLCPWFTRPLSCHDVSDSNNDLSSGIERLEEATSGIWLDRKTGGDVFTKLAYTVIDYIVCCAHLRFFFNLLSHLSKL